MNTFHYTTLAALLAVSACGGKPSETATAPAAPSATSADAFVAKYHADFRAFYPTLQGPQWLAATYITDDSQAVASRANEQYLEFSFNTAQAAKPFYALKDLSLIHI